MQTREEISAGGVVYRKKAGNYEVLISKHSGYHKWVLPKGRVEAGESLEQTALREVEEEVGVKGEILASLGEPETYVYIFNGIRVSKKVHYFLMEYLEGNETNHDFEMEAVEWVPFEEAIHRMAYGGAKHVLEQAQVMVLERKS